MLKRLKYKTEHTLDALHDRFQSKAKAAKALETVNECLSILSGLRVTLEGLPKTHVPMLDAVNELLESIERYKIGIQAVGPYLEIMGDLSELLKHLDQHFGQHQLWSPNLSHLAWGIAHETQILLSHRQGENLGLHRPTQKEREMAMGCYRRIRTQLARFTLVENTKMWQRTKFESESTPVPFLRPLAAEYNSPESHSMGRAGCAFGTRNNLMKELQAWVHDCKGQRAQWITGSAGTGKTTIAYSLCEYLDRAGLLAASFFCSQKLGCGSIAYIITSISAQLARYSHPFQSKLSHMHDTYPETLSRPIALQTMRLIVTPLRQVGHTFPTNAIIVVDGLDECDDSKGITQMLIEIIKSLPYFPLKFLFTGRTVLRNANHPRQIMDTMELGRDLDTLELDIHQTDIENYVQSECEKAGLFSVNATSFCNLAPTSFRFAVTLARFLTSRRSELAQDRLQHANATLLVYCVDGNRNPLHDLLSLTILSSLCTPSNEEHISHEVSKILQTLVCAREPLTWGVVASLSGFDSTSNCEGSIEKLLETLYGVSTNDPLMSIDRSLSDCICNSAQSGTLYCDSASTNADIAQVCFDLMNSQLVSFNICGLQSSFIAESEVSSMNIQLRYKMTSELMYACRYWVVHLSAAHASDSLVTELHDFLSTQLLAWLEVMSQTQRTSLAAAVGNMQSLQLVRIIPEETRLLLDDAASFAEAYLSCEALDYIPHLYLSVLAFWPQDQPVSRTYKHLFVSLPVLSWATPGVTAKEHDKRLHNTKGSLIQSQPTSILSQTIHHHTDDVRCVAYSPNGAYIASGSDDCNICIWDSHSGWLVGKPLTGHTSLVLSVAYSLDSAYLVSGSEDNTVRIWDAHTGQQVGQPLIGHTSNVNSVAYSPDGAYIASGSDDKTIRIWDAKTGKRVGKPLTDHTNWVFSVVYSPDGAYIASGSRDETIRIWDAHTGQQIGLPLTGHTGSVRSVAYSPDGTHIASGSSDQTIRIWDAHTGQQVGQPLAGHTDWVDSVAYSPDGAYIASGSYGKTIRIWDAKTGKQVGQPLTGHTGWVYSVAFSPNGAYLASGSYDNTVRIWDVQHHINQTIPIEILTDDASPEGYTIDRNGWVLDHKQNRLVCIPPSLQCQYRSRCAEDEILQLDLRGVKLGEGWYECYKPQSVDKEIASEINAQASQ